MVYGSGGLNTTIFESRKSTVPADLASDEGGPADHCLLIISSYGGEQRGRKFSCFLL
jgi:hypothetical protein